MARYTNAGWTKVALLACLISATAVLGAQENQDALKDLKVARSAFSLSAVFFGGRTSGATNIYRAEGPAIQPILGLTFPASAGVDVLLSAGTSDRLSTFIQSEMKAKKIPGLSIAVADSASVLWSQGFGIADKSKKSAFTASTISNVGSVSKVFTCSAIMKLVEQGKVDLDESLSAYLPEFKPAARGTNLDDITVRRLLSHHSGLSSDSKFRFILGNKEPDGYPHQNAEILAAANAMTVPRGPDVAFSYSNMGYSLLGLVVERVSGMSFNDFLSKEIFKPLGMEDSSFLIQEEKRNRYAMGYLGGKPQFIPYIRDMPAGSLCSTSDDMGKYLQSLLASYKDGSGIHSRSSITQLLTVQNPGVPLDFDFKAGLTWWIVDLQSIPGEFLAAHGGDLPPYHALIAMLPDRDLAVSILINGCEGLGSFSLAEILSAAFKEFASAKGQASFAPERKAGPFAAPEPMPDRLLADLPGFYSTPIGLCEVKRSGKGLKALVSGMWMDMSYRADASLALSLKILGFPVKLDILKEVYCTAEVLEGKQTLNFRTKGVLMGPGLKIQASDPGVAWLARSGDYVQVNEEPSPQYQAFRLGKDSATGFFCLYLKSEGSWTAYALRRVNDDEMVIEGQGRGMGETIRVIQGSEGAELFFEGLMLRRKK